MKASYDDDDDRTEDATNHDALVVEMLLQLKYSTSCHQQQASRTRLGWGGKQPRSASSVSGWKSKERIGHIRRCSPSTPLSWSGGSGGCDGAEGCEASSLQTTRSPISRSKISLDGSGVNGASTNSSKLKNKKTYAELMEEEEIILKECMHMNQLDLMTKLAKNNTFTAAGASGSIDAAGRQEVMKAEAHDCIPSTLSQCKSEPSSKSCKAECDMPDQKRANFLLPDLNMMPPELDSAS